MGLIAEILYTNQLDDDGMDRARAASAVGCPHNYYTLLVTCFDAQASQANYLRSHAVNNDQFFYIHKTSISRTLGISAIKYLIKIETGDHLRR